MIKLLIIILFFNIVSFSDLYFFSKEIRNNINYTISWDYFSIPYSLLTGKGDCYNMAKLYNFGLNIRGISNEIIIIKGDKANHAIVKVNDSEYGCYMVDVTNRKFDECVGGDKI